MTVNFFHSLMPGAPQASGQVGVVKAILDACLVNGWGLAAIDSLVILGGVATVNVAAGHPYEVGSATVLAGVVTTGGSLNGVQRVLSATNNSFSFATTLVNQTASSPGTHKLAPLGWECPAGFSAGSVAAYRSVDLAGTQCWVRVDDSGTNDVRVRGYETMTDVNTGTGPFPDTGQQGGSGLFWAKSSATGTTARPWILWGDERTFYFAIAQSGNANNFSTQSFGDFTPQRSVDSYACRITGAFSTIFSAAGAVDDADVFFCRPDFEAVCYVARASSGVGNAVRVRRVVLHGSLSSSTTEALLSGEVSPAHYSYPNPADGGLILSPILIVEPTSGGQIGVRGRERGIYFAPQSVGLAGFVARGYVPDTEALPGRNLRVVPNGVGPGFADATGPY